MKSQVFLNCKWGCAGKNISPRGYGPKDSVVDSKIDFKLRPPGVLVAENS